MEVNKDKKQEQKKYFFTKNGLEKIKAEYKNLVEVRRPEVAEKIKVARDFGDLSENAEYDAAKDEQGMIEARIREIEAQIANAVLINEKDVDSSKVGLGVKVKVQDLTYDETIVYQITGTSEASITDNKIDYTSPLASAIMGKKKGDVVEYKCPAGKVKVKILEITKA